MPLLVDVGAVLGNPVLPAVVGVVVVSTWVVCVGPSTVQVYVHACRSLHNSQLYPVQTVPVLTSFMHCPSDVRHFTAGCRLMLGPLTAHTFTL